ncbi:uncharacterized protein ACN63O_006478 [Diretmus argenteus]
MWEQEEFAKHWRNEFPDGNVPEMDLNSVEDIEAELEKCKRNLKRLQRALDEEKFKVIYLQTTVARQKRSYDQGRFDGKDENFNGRRGGDGETGTSRVVPPSGGVKLPVIAGGVRLSGRTGKPLPVPPRKPTFNKGNAEPTTVDSDHDYEDVELNENFVRSNLVAPRTASRTTAPHRDALRAFRLSRDLDSGDDGRLSPSLMHVHSSASRGSGCSTPDRRSDGYLSSDHDDSSSAAGTLELCSQTKSSAQGPVLRLEGGILLSAFVS